MRRLISVFAVIVLFGLLENWVLAPRRTCVETTITNCATSFSNAWNSLQKWGAWFSRRLTARISGYFPIPGRNN